MSTHFERRAPQSNGVFSWGRFPGETCISYRLFRRDHTGALHCSILSVAKTYPRQQLALDLRRKRRQLREKVDVIDLAAMGVEA